MEDLDKLFSAIETLKPNTPLVFRGSVVTQETFNTIEWEVDGSFTTTNPHSELTWTAVKTEMDKL
jgi:hypothetical protein